MIQNEYCCVEYVWIGGNSELRSKTKVMNKHIEHIDDLSIWNYDGSSTAKQKSTDLVDLSIRKNWFGNIISLNISNLLNERYEKPATYSQDGRQLKFGLIRTY